MLIFDCLYDKLRAGPSIATAPLVTTRRACEDVYQHVKLYGFTPRLLHLPKSKNFGGCSMSEITTRPKLFTVTEAAEYLRVSKSWVYKAAEARKLRHFKIGKRLLFDPRDLDTFLQTKLVEV